MHSKGSANPTLSDNRWENNPVMSVSGMYTLDTIGKLISNALMNVLGRSEEFTFYPGFVTTRSAAHQELHVDSSHAFKVEAGKGSYILHMPLSVEGLSLRIANLDDDLQAQLQGPLSGVGLSGDIPPTIHVNDFFYHVPFGQALLMPETQWHAGHYGKKDNLRFHAVLRCGLIETSSLLLLAPVLDNNFPEVTIKYKLDLNSNLAENVVTSSTTSRDKQVATYYIKNLRERMPGKLFLNCLPGIKK